MSSNALKYSAYNAGRACYERGGRLNECPYNAVTKGALYTAWMDGYVDATLAYAPLYA